MEQHIPKETRKQQENQYNFHKFHIIYLFISPNRLHFIILHDITLNTIS